MTKAATAVTCSLLLLAGCGGSSHGTSAGGVPSRKASCEKAKTAKAEYEKAFAELGLELSNKPLLADASAATGALRTVGEELRRATAGGEKLKADQIVAAYSRQEKELMAYASHDLATAHSYSRGIDKVLFQAEANLRAICPGA
jgi:hypothetical protein